MVFSHLLRAYCGVDLCLEVSFLCDCWPWQLTVILNTGRGPYLCLVWLWKRADLYVASCRF